MTEYEPRQLDPGRRHAGRSVGDRGESTPRGYRAADLAEPWRRYLSATSATSATSLASHVALVADVADNPPAEELPFEPEEE
jgi:hypothetical protein